LRYRAEPAEIGQIWFARLSIDLSDFCCRYFGKLLKIKHLQNGPQIALVAGRAAKNLGGV